MSDNSLLKLVNPPFQIEFKGQDYDVHKANLSKVVLYSQRVSELSEAGAKNTDPLLVSYALYLILKDAIPELTEQDVLDNVPGDIEVFATLVSLGFVNPTKAKTLLQLITKATAEAEKTPITPDSLPPSPTEPDGPQDKSAN